MELAASWVSAAMRPASIRGRTARMKALESYSPGLHMAIQDVEQLSGDVCGRCISFENGRCSERDGLRVREADHGCPMFIAA